MPSLTGNCCGGWGCEANMLLANEIPQRIIQQFTDRLELTL